MVIVWNLTHPLLIARGYTSHPRVVPGGHMDCEVTFGKESISLLYREQWYLCQALLR